MSSPSVKALTLWQPWASLVPLGAKPIETRSWSTSHRGPLAIHAAARKPDPFGACSVNAPIGNYDVGQLDPGAPRRMWRNDVHEPPIDLPLAAVVASVRLADVVPTELVRWDDRVAERYEGRPWIRVCDADGVTRQVEAMPSVEAFGDFSPGRFAWLLDEIAPTLARCPLCWDRPPEAGPGLCISACPVCKAGTRRVEPVPTRGRQGLWTWTP